MHEHPKSEEPRSTIWFAAANNNNNGRVAHDGNVYNLDERKRIGHTGVSLNQPPDSHVEIAGE